MTIKTQVSSLLNKKMDRQEFVKHIGIGLVAVTGVGTVLKMMAPEQNTPAQTVGQAYGISAYGGTDNKA